MDYAKQQVMELEWDRRKAAANYRKHGVTFAEAATAFADPLALAFADPDHSTLEHRELTFGLSRSHRLLVVSHTQRADRTMIISDRIMMRTERRTYEED